MQSQHWRMCISTHFNDSGNWRSSIFAPHVYEMSDRSCSSSWYSWNVSFRLENGNLHLLPPHWQHVAQQESVRVTFVLGVKAYPFRKSGIWKHHRKVSSDHQILILDQVGSEGPEKYWHPYELGNRCDAQHYHTSWYKMCRMLTGVLHESLQLRSGGRYHLWAIRIFNQGSMKCTDSQKSLISSLLAESNTPNGLPFSSSRSVMLDSIGDCTDILTSAL